MEVYTLTSKFLPKDVLRDYTSIIWTERYFGVGEVEIVVPPTPYWIRTLAPGGFLWRRGGMEIMEILTHNIEDGLLKVNGKSFLQYLNQRQSWFPNPEYDGSDPNVSQTVAYSDDTMTAGQLISSAVYEMAMGGVSFGSPYTNIELNWAADVIPGLTVGPTDANGAVGGFSIPLGPLYDSIASLAQEQGVGLKMYLYGASYDSGYILKFATYRGKNRTSENPNPAMLVRLTPKMDALTDIKELTSIEKYKNVFYVHYKEPTAGEKVSVHYIPGLAVPTGFARRGLMVKADDIYFNPALPDYATKVANYRARTAQNAIANYIYVQAVDGNVSAKIPYIYGKDFGLGDVIELEGYSGIFSKARVTEYIWSENQFGEEEYPTLSVLDPVYIGTIPDLEPDEEFPEWYENPDWDVDFDDDFDEDVEHDTEDDDDTDPNDEEDPNPDPHPYFTPEVDFTWEII